MLQFQIIFCFFLIVKISENLYLYIIQHPLHLIFVKNLCYAQENILGVFLQTDAIFFHFFKLDLSILFSLASQKKCWVLSCIQFKITGIHSVVAIVYLLLLEQTNQVINVHYVSVDIFAEEIVLHMVYMPDEG